MLENARMVPSLLLFGTAAAFAARVKGCQEPAPAALAGVGEIRKTTALLAEAGVGSRGSDVAVLPLHGNLTPSQQDAAIRWVAEGEGGGERGVQYLACGMVIPLAVLWPTTTPAGLVLPPANARCWPPPAQSPPSQLLTPIPLKTLQARRSQPPARGACYTHRRIVFDHRRRACGGGFGAVPRSALLPRDRH